MRIAEIIVLVRAKIYTEPGADDSLSVENARAPCQAHSRSEIVPVRRIHGRTRWAKAFASEDVDHEDTVLHLFSDRVVLVSQPEIQREIGAHLKFILAVAHPQSTPHAPDAQRRVIAHRID